MSFHKGLNELAADVIEMNNKWWQNPRTGEWKERNIGEMLMLVTSELAEALEADRKNLKDDKLQQYNGFEVEIVDAIIRLLDMSRLFTSGTLQEIYEAKMLYNLNREDHKNEHRLGEHGKKY